MPSYGPICFGIVIGFITYRTLKHTTTTGISDLTAVIAAIGGGAVLTLFPAGSEAFGNYAFGLMGGFFGYLALSILIAAIFTSDDNNDPSRGARVANEFLGSRK